MFKPESLFTFSKHALNSTNLYTENSLSVNQLKQRSKAHRLKEVGVPFFRNNNTTACSKRRPLKYNQNHCHKSKALMKAFVLKSNTHTIYQNVTVDAFYVRSMCFPHFSNRHKKRHKVNSSLIRANIFPPCIETFY